MPPQAGSQRKKKKTAGSLPLIAGESRHHIQGGRGLPADKTGKERHGGRATATIPGDLISEMLVRLPAKSVGRLQCVSKQWLSLASDPKFVHAHAALAPISGFVPIKDVADHIPLNNASHLDCLPDPSFPPRRRFPGGPLFSCRGLLLDHGFRHDNNDNPLHHGFCQDNDDNGNLLHHRFPQDDNDNGNLLHHGFPQDDDDDGNLLHDGFMQVQGDDNGNLLRDEFMQGDNGKAVIVDQWSRDDEDDDDDNENFSHDELMQEDYNNPNFLERWCLKGDDDDDGANKTFYICNPMTKQLRFIPRPMSGMVFSYAFALDPLEPSWFKVATWEDCSPYKSSRLHVYSSMTQSWRVVYEVTSNDSRDWFDWQPVSWNGSLAWPSQQGSFILLDVEKEKVRKVAQPYRRCCYFGESRGCLYFIGWVDDTDMIDILEMESESTGWSVLYHHLDLGLTRELYPEMPKYCNPSCNYFVRGDSRSEDELILILSFKCPTGRYDSKVVSFRPHSRLCSTIVDRHEQIELVPHVHTLLSL